MDVRIKSSGKVMQLLGIRNYPYANDGKGRAVVSVLPESEETIVPSAIEFNLDDVEALDEKATATLYPPEPGEKDMSDNEDWDDDEWDIEPTTEAEKKPAPKAKTRITSKSLKGKIIRPGTEIPPRGRHTKIVAFVNDNMGEATFEELEEFLEGDKGTPASHISWAVNRNFLEVVEDV